MMNKLCPEICGIYSSKDLIILSKIIGFARLLYFQYLSCPAIELWNITCILNFMSDARAVHWDVTFFPCGV